MTSDDERSPRMMTSWTLGAIKQRNLVLEGYCQSDGCGNFYVFDVEQLIASAGPDYLVPEILPGITCSACGGALKAKLAMMRPDEEEGSDASGDAERLRFFEAEAESAYAKMYDAMDQTTAAGHYSNAKEALHAAIAVAMELEDRETSERLQARLTHIKAVFRSQFC